MPLRILTNTQSLYSQQALGKAQVSLNKALERLSTGSRINHSYDDPSGYLFATQMQFQIQGTDAGTNNLRMAVDLLNTADSYTRTMTENMQRLNELATQATNSLLTTAQRTGLSYEFNEILSEIERLATNASYNGRLMMTGSLQAVTIQSGFSVADVVTMSINCLTTGTNGMAIYSGGAALFGLGTVASAAAAITAINSVTVGVLSPAIAAIGAQAAGWSKSAEAQDAYTTNLRAARSRIWDADIAAETTNLTNAQVIVQSGIAALAQANSAQTLALGLIGG